jgi:pilus assembly protein Flp/PilA
MEGNMLKLWAKKEAFIRSEEGATAIEYGLIAAGIAVAISVVVFTVGTDVFNVFGTVDTALQPAAAG